MAKEKGKKEDLLHANDIVRSRWKIGKKLGGGGFGMVYEVLDMKYSSTAKASDSGGTHKELYYALKAESTQAKVQVLKVEVAVLKAVLGSHHFCQLKAFGQDLEVNYIVMTKVGKNLSELRKRQPGHRFSLGTSLRLCLQMIPALGKLHSVGFIHRDIKPSNFAMGEGNQSRACILFDFGLSRKYLDDQRQVKEARRTPVGFRGTVRYASLNVHEGKDTGCRDDLWSLFYLCCEFVHGNLPWSKLVDKEDVRKKKAEYNHQLLVVDLPGAIGEWLAYLRTLEYDSIPDYVKLQDLLRRCQEGLGVDDADPYDWEKSSSSAPLSLTSFCSPVVQDHPHGMKASALSQHDIHTHSAMKRNAASPAANHVANSTDDPHIADYHHTPDPGDQRHSLCNSSQSHPVPANAVPPRDERIQEFDRPDIHLAASDESARLSSEALVPMPEPEMDIESFQKTQKKDSRHIVCMSNLPSQRSSTQQEEVAKLGGSTQQEEVAKLGGSTAVVAKSAISQSSIFVLPGQCNPLTCRLRFSDAPEDSEAATDCSAPDSCLWKSGFMTRLLRGDIPAIKPPDGPPPPASLRRGGMYNQRKKMYKRRGTRIPLESLASLKSLHIQTDLDQKSD
eukprot:scpid10302/ scgid5738/ Tau-tubulin kinase 1; Brain-derived tau kinase